MFTRRDQPSTKPQTETRPESDATAPAARAPEQPATPPVAMPQPIAPREPAAPREPVAQSATQDMSLIAAGDVFDGTLTTTNGVRVLGTVRGTIESKSNVNIDADALVEADITAENVTIGGTYRGTLNCNGRLEVTASGRASGDLETGRILLHEGGFFEGTLHMKQEQQSAASSGTSDTAGESTAGAKRRR